MELLIVILIATLLLSVVLPFSMEMYNRYRASVIAEKFLIFLARKRVEAFLYGKDLRIEAKDNRLVSTDGQFFEHEDCLVNLKGPIEFYSKGTSSGGVVEITCKKYSFNIEVEPFTGRMMLRRL